MEKVGRTNKIPFSFIQCSSSHIDEIKEGKTEITEGALYFVLDTKQILLGKNSEFVPMGTGSGVIFGIKETDLNNINPEVVFSLSELEEEYRGSYPQPNDLIFNKDGCFYRVLELKNGLSGSINIITKRLTVAGSGGGGGGTGPSGGGTGSADILFDIVNPIVQQTISSDEDVVFLCSYAQTINNKPTGDGKVEFIVNDIPQKKITIKQSTETQEFYPITLPKEWLIKNHENTVVIRCYDSAGRYVEYESGLIFSIKVVELTFQPTNSSSDRIILTDDNFINFNFTATGLECKKKAKAKLYNCNGTGTPINLESDEITSKSGNSSITINNLSYGVYILKIWLEGIPVEAASEEEEMIYTKELTYKIMCTKETEKREKDYVNREHIPLFASFIYPNDKNDYEFTQGETLKLYYRYYDPRESDTLSSDILPKKPGTLKIRIKDSNDKDYKTPIKVSSNLKSREYSLYELKDYPAGNNVSILLDYEFYPYKTPDVAVSALGLSYNGKDYTASPSNEKQYIKVLETDVENDSIIKTNLQFNLTAFGRTNGDDLGKTWSDGDVTTTFTGMNWTEEGNGWVKDDNGETALKLNGLGRAFVDFKPFSLKGDDKKNIVDSDGLTFEIEFMIKDINNRSSVAIDCKSANGTGFTIKADTATLSSDFGDTLDCKYSDGVKTKISFVIEPKKRYDISTNRFMYIYLNGVLSRVCQYSPSATFGQGTDIKTIEIGSSDCTTYVYSLRCYSVSLDHKQILKNYIADIQSQSQKTSVDYDNRIYINGDISFAEIKKRVPVMIIKTVKDSDVLPTSKTSNTPVIVNFYHNITGEKIENQEAYMNVQGTSSLEYPVKNYTLLFHDKQSFNKDQIATRLYCLKADFAESTSTHNTQHGNYIHVLYNYNTPAQQEDSKCRTSIFGFPMVLFHEYENGKYKFIGKYNFNYDRYSLEAYGLGDVEINESKKYKYELIPKDVECWEAADNKDGCMFLVDFDRMLADEIAEGSELWEARASISDDKEVMREMYNWVYSTNTNQATNALLEPGQETYGHTNDTSNFRLDKFKNEFTNYFDKEACLFYYIYSFVSLMIDQRAKNMNLCKWGEDGKWAPWFYDNDSCFGLNNQGALVFDYWAEDSDPNVYSAGQSVLWTNFRNAFGNDIKRKYTELRNGLTEENYLKYFISQGSDSWSESIYNEDAYLKYIDSFGDRNDLNKALGTGEEHLKYFIKNRIKYCDGKWGHDDGKNHITLRANKPLLEDYATKFANAGLNPSQGSTKILVNYLSSQEFLNEIRADIPLTSINVDGKTLSSIIQDGFDSREFNRSQTSVFEDAIGFYFKYNIISLYDMTETSTDYVYNKNGISKHLSKEQYNDFINQNEYELLVLNEAESLISLDFKVVQRKRTLKAVPPDSTINLTAGSNTYLDAIYGTAGSEVLKSAPVRTNAGETKIFKGPATLPTNFNIKIPVADKISSLGDLSALYLGDFQVNTATGLRILKLGNDTPGYHNVFLENLQVDNLRLLTNLDITNCIELKGNLNLSTCPNLLEVKALGTNLQSVSLSATGQLNKLLLPKTLTKLILTNQINLTYNEDGDSSNGLYIEKENGLYNNLKNIRIENCEHINTLALLQSIINNDFTIERQIRITGIDWSFDSNENCFLTNLISENSKIYGLLPDGGESNTKIPPQLFGKCHFSAIDGEAYEQLSQTFPGLEITYDKLVSKVFFLIGGRQDSNTYESGEYSHYQLSYLKNEQISKDTFDTIIKVQKGNDFVQVSTNAEKLTYFTKSGDFYICKNDITFIVDVTDKAIEIAKTQKVESINSQFAGAVDPVTSGEISAPIRLPSDRYLYETFIGWSIVPNSSQDVGIINKIKGNTKLYAAFSKKTRTYRVDFYNNPKEEPSAEVPIHTVEVEYEKTPIYDKPNPSYPGNNKDYSFAGWKPSIQEKILEDTRLDAQYHFIGETKIRLIEKQITSYPEENNIKTVGEYAFYNCDALTSITLPKAETIKANAFLNCKKLVEIRLPSSDFCELENVNAFANTPIETGNGFIYVPEEKVAAYQIRNNWKQYATKIKSLNSV